VDGYWVPPKHMAVGLSDEEWRIVYLDHVRPYMPKQNTDDQRSEQQFILDFSTVNAPRLMFRHYLPLKNHRLLQDPQAVAHANMWLARFGDPLIPVPPKTEGAPKKQSTYIPTGRPRGRPAGTKTKPKA